MVAMVTLHDSHFALFGLPESFALDEAALEEAYRTVQAQVHPDRFVAAGDAQKRVAMQWAAHVNEAYQTLRDPLRRAVYVLHLRGIDAAAQNSTAMAPAFLMQQMEWREQIEAAVAAKNIKALDALAMRLRADERARFDALARLLDVNEKAANEKAANAVREMMFIGRILGALDTQIERLEG